MLQLTKTGEYAVRAMLHLASLPQGTCVQISEVSDTWNVPESFLRKITMRLRRAGLLTSFRGNGGGISLARPASTLTLLDVVEAAEGPLALNACLIRPGECHHDEWCAVHLVWCEAQRALKAVLGSQNLAHLAARSQETRRTLTLSPTTVRR